MLALYLLIRAIESFLHKRVVDRHDKDVADLLDLGVVDPARDVLAGAGASEGTGDANDVAVADLELLSQVDAVGGRVLKQGAGAGDLVANLDAGGGRGVEAALGQRAGSSHGGAAGGSVEGHFGCLRIRLDTARFDGRLDLDSVGGCRVEAFLEKLGEAREAWWTLAAYGLRCRRAAEHRSTGPPGRDGQVDISD